MSKNREYEVGEIIETFGHSDYWESQLLKDGYEYSIIDVDGGHVKYQITEVIESVTSAEKIEMLHKILDIVMQINEGAEVREGNGHPTAFYTYSGHVNKLYISIYGDGWANGDPYTAFDISFDEPTLYTANKVYDELVNIRENLYPED